jgi:hypothetical protein
VATAKQEGKREAYQEQQKEMAEMRGMLDVALRKREELEFKLAQKDDEVCSFQYFGNLLTFLLVARILYHKTIRKARSPTS